MNIKGFMHIYAVNDWKEIVKTQIDKIEKSGLMDKINSLNIGIVYPPNEFPDIKFLETMPKISLSYCFNTPGYEQSLTLANIRSYSSFHREGLSFYIHTKGISHKKRTRAFQDDWRNMMEHFIIERHEECLQHLTHADVVGVNWHLGEGYMGATSRMCGGLRVTPHFSGNFWWARNEYIRTLPDPFPITVSKYECEFWIGLNKPRVVELFNSHIHHHQRNYPKELYFGKKLASFYNIV